MAWCCSFLLLLLGIEDLSEGSKRVWSDELVFKRLFCFSFKACRCSFQFVFADSPSLPLLKLIIVFLKFKVECIRLCVVIGVLELR